MEKKNTFSGNDVKKNAPVKKGEGVKDMYRINERIRAKEVRLVGENVEQGIYSIQEAIRIADEQGLDLVEISIKIPIFRSISSADLRKRRRVWLRPCTFRAR